MIHKAFIFLCFIVFVYFSTAAQEKQKVAVFDPVGEVENSIKDIVREEISSGIVNSESYSIFERMLINSVLEENKFQMSGLVDETEISELGKKMGANFVFVTTISMLDKDYYISCKMIEVLTARIEKQQTAKTNDGINDLINTTQNVVLRILDEEEKKNEEVKIQNSKKETNKERDVDIIPSFDLVKKFDAETSNMLVARKVDVYYGDQKLSSKEVRNMMINLNALKMYNKSIRNNKIGKYMIFGGVLAICGGGALMSIDYSYEQLPYLSEAISCFAIGTAGIIGGVILRNKAKKGVQKAVGIDNSTNTHNHSSNVELGYSINKNSIGLVLNF